MFTKIIKKKITINDSTMKYIVFGSGKKNLVIIPGLGDSLNNIHQSRLIYAKLYQMFAKDYKVYVFSRRENLSTKTTVKSMAKDQLEALYKLNINNAYVIGISLGGMIAQQLALMSPNTIKKLALVITAPRTNDTIDEVITNWIKLANEKKHQELYIDTIDKTYTEKYLKIIRNFYPFLEKINYKKDLTNYLIQAKSIQSHNVLKDLKNVISPVLVICGEEDKIVGNEPIKEFEKNLPNAKIIAYKGYGHAVHQELKEARLEILNFFNSN